MSMTAEMGLAMSDATPDDVADLMQGRRTVDLFKPERPPQHMIEQAIVMACWAPNHKLTQPWRFYHLGPRSMEAVIHLNYDLMAEEKGPEIAAKKDQRWRAVPGFLVVTQVRDDDALRAHEDYGACCCAIQNFMLYLWSCGVASKWTSGAVTRDSRFFQCLDIDAEHEEVVALLWYGYPNQTPKKNRKPVADVLFERS